MNTKILSVDKQTGKPRLKWPFNKIKVANGLQASPKWFFSSGWFWLSGSWASSGSLCDFCCMGEMQWWRKAGWGCHLELSWREEGISTSQRLAGRQSTSQILRTALTPNSRRWLLIREKIMLLSFQKQRAQSQMFTHNHSAKKVRDGQAEHPRAQAIS